MKLGALDISTVKLGANQVQAVYQGVDLVWQNAPVATAATGVGQTSFTANWNAYTGAVVYLLDVSESSDFSTFVYEDQQVNAPTTSYVVIGLNPNTTYYYRVRASTEALTDADYQAVLDYATTQGYTLPSAGQQTLQNQLVVDLKDAGVWSKLDTFSVFATDGDSDFALIDWKRLTQYTAFNSPTFTADEGFTGNGTSSYIDCNYNGATNRVNYEDDSAHMMVWARIFGASSELATTNISTARSSIRRTTSGNNGINSTSGSSGSLSSSVGFIMFSRYNSSNYNQYNNNSLLTNVPQPRNSSGGQALVLRNAIGYSNSQISFCSLGANLSSEASSYYTALNTYITSL
jgi:hypothetical protein